MKLFSLEIKLAWEVALAVAEMAALRLSETEGNEKDEVNVGHHAIVTKRDGAAQTAALQCLAHMEGMFLTEEKEGTTAVARDRLITTEGAVDITDNELTWIIDPLDGSSFRNRCLPEWSVSIAPVRKGTHLGGAIFAPEVLGGFGARGERGKGVEVWEKNPSGNSFRPAQTMRPRNRKKAVIFLGLDIHFLPQFADFVYEVAPLIQTTSSTTSALGLAYLIAGKIDAFVQPVQAPWDWAAGYPLVEEVGGKFLFYHYREGDVVPLPGPDAKSYDPVWRNTAFIAGEPNLVDWLFEVLQQKWRRL